VQLVVGCSIEYEGFGVFMHFTEYVGAHSVSLYGIFIRCHQLLLRARRVSRLCTLPSLLFHALTAYPLRTKSCILLQKLPIPMSI
jgi:hypothetical protein